MIPDWDGAVCTTTDPEIFFPEQGGGSNDVAKKMCRACPALNACLTFALEHPQETGVWGGTTSRERVILRKRAA